MLSLTKRLKQRSFALSMICCFLILAVVGSSQMTSVEAKKTYQDKVHVLLFTNANSTNYQNKSSSSAYTALTLDSRINVTFYNKLIDKPYLIPNETAKYNFSNFDVVVMENFFPRLKSDQQYIMDKIQENNIGILFMGGYYHENVDWDLIEPYIPAYFTSPIDAIDNMVGNPLANVS